MARANGLLLSALFALNLPQLLHYPGHVFRQVGHGLDAFRVLGHVAGFEAVGDGPVGGAGHEHAHDDKPEL